MIDNAEYQANAQAERDAFFIHQAQHDAQSLANIDSINVNAFDPFLDPFTATVQPRVGRRSMAIRPLSYENQPTPASHHKEIASDLPANNGKNEVPPHPTEEDTSETDQGGRFQHLELG